jgi:hypothetical protein
MSSKNDWVPGTDNDFADFLEQYALTVSRNTAGAEPVWTHIPADRVTELVKANGDFRIAYEKLKKAHTSGDVIAKNEARDAGKDLPHSTFTHRKRFRFDFEGDSGQTVYFCLRYENEKGGNDGEGPFGPIMSAIIP